MDCDSFMNLDAAKLADFLKSQCRLTVKGLVNIRTKRLVKAVLPVHIFGNPCDMPVIMELAREFGLKVIEDATESLGSYYTTGKYKGKHTGTIGDFGVYSFNGNKIVTVPNSEAAKVPQIGWNTIKKLGSWDATALAGLADGGYMYFVHSFYVAPEKPGPPAL